MVNIEDLIKRMEEFEERLGAIEDQRARESEEEEQAMKEEMDQLEKEQQEYLYGGRI